MTRTDSHIREEAQYVNVRKRTRMQQHHSDEGPAVKPNAEALGWETKSKPDRTFDFTDLSMLTAYLDKSRENWDFSIELWYCINVGKGD